MSDPIRVEAAATAAAVSNELDDLVRRSIELRKVSGELKRWNRTRVCPTCGSVGRPAFVLDADEAPAAYVLAGQ